VNLFFQALEYHFKLNFDNDLLKKIKNDKFYFLLKPYQLLASDLVSVNYDYLSPISLTE